MQHRSLLPGEKKERNGVRTAGLHTQNCCQQLLQSYRLLLVAAAHTLQWYITATRQLS
jgi:hypothetical protein